MPGRITSWKGIETFIELIHRLKDPSLIGIVMGPVANNKKLILKSSKRWHQTLIWMRLKFYFVMADLILKMYIKFHLLFLTYHQRLNLWENND